MGYLRLAFILMFSVISQVALAEPPAPSAASGPAATASTPLTKQEAQVLAIKVFRERRPDIKKYTVSVSRLLDLDRDNLLPDFDKANILLFGFTGTGEYARIGWNAVVRVNIRTREVLYIPGQ